MQSIKPNSSFSSSSCAGIISREYFPHIDGIRALAVLPVVMFHILATLCPGGFVGVDVFFVISGYLITGGILRDLKNNNFSIRKFYYRRIRRIMPAYFAMIACVFIAGCALYYATPLIFLGDAVVKGTLFLANFHFWLLGGNYFVPQTHSQALLHLWSLSVEEQFYFFIPLFFFIIWRFRRNLVVPVLVLLTVLSLTGAIHAVMTGKQNNAFYFPHFRAWELLSGSLLAMIPSIVLRSNGYELASMDVGSTAPNRSWSTLATLETRRSLFASFGLLMVGVTIFGISSRTPFPGLAAVPPVIGTLLLIRYGQSGWVARLLSCHPLVMTGKISYSLYLWHWPVTVFWKYIVYDQLYFLDYLGIFLLSLLLGYLSWKFIELPVRTSPVWTMRRSYAFTALGIVVLVVLGTACVHYKGWFTTLHPRANERAGSPHLALNLFLTHKVQVVLRGMDSLTGSSFFKNSIYEKEQLALANGSDGSSAIGGQGQPLLLLIGDSHAGALRYGLDVSLRERNVPGYLISCSGSDIFDLSLPESKVAQKKMSELPQVTGVILVERWLRKDWSNSREAESICAKVEEFVRYLKANNKTAFIVTDVPNYDCPLNEMAARMEIITPRQVESPWIARGQSAVKYSRMQGQPINQRLATICKKTGAILIPLHLSLKEDDRYLFFENQNSKSIPLYRDLDHLSQAGSLRAAQFMMPFLFRDNASKNLDSLTGLRVD